MADLVNPAGSRAVLATDLRNDPAIIDAYRQHHREVWPEVIASLQHSGIRRMDIYMLGRRLVMVLETDGRDYRDCFAAHAASHPRVTEWEELMRSMQEPPDGETRGNWWTRMEPLFTLPGTSHPTASGRLR
jgi:L-rhamnose mutarotase